jgi:hypothetical protein
MPNRVQTLRSSVPGNVPQAATRSPGELWVNFADGHLGYIDASQTAQKLLAVRLFVSTAPYAVGDFVVYAGVLYQATAPSAAGAFTAANWTKIGTAQDLSQYLPLAGGTLTGALNLPAAAPTVATQAANKSYVDAGDATVLAAANTKLPLAGGTLTGALNGTTATFSGVAAAADPPAEDSSSKLVTTAWFNSHQPVTKENSNRIINGDMLINQRNAPISGAVAAYVVDRWAYATGAAVGTAQGNNTAAMVPNGFSQCLTFTSSSAHVSAAGDSCFFYQTIEANMGTDFAWGTPNAQPVTLSFWINATTTGTYSGAITNQPTPPTRSYPFSFPVVAGGWQKVVIPIPGDIAGTWVMSGNSGGVTVRFDIGSGATFRGSAGAWVNGNLNGVTGAVQVTATNAAIIQLTGVKLEIGSVATPFNRQSLAKSMADCQRYYQVGSMQANGWAGIASAAVGAQMPSFPVVMRATPTMVPTWTTQTNGTGNLTPQNAGFYQVYATTTAVGANSNVAGTFVASAEL